MNKYVKYILFCLSFLIIVIATILYYPSRLDKSNFKFVQFSDMLSLVDISKDLIIIDNVMDYNIIDDFLLILSAKTYIIDTNIIYTCYEEYYIINLSTNEVSKKLSKKYYENFLKINNFENKLKIPDSYNKNCICDKDFIIKEINQSFIDAKINKQDQTIMILDVKRNDGQCL